MSSGVAGMRTKMVRRWQWPAVRSTPELLRLGMLGRQVKTGVWQELYDVGTGGRAQSLARLNLGHELEVFREVFRADAMQTAIHNDAEFECHSFWHWQPVQLLQQWCNVVVSTDAVDQSRCRVENGLQSAELTGRKTSQDSVAVVQPR